MKFGRLKELDLNDKTAWYDIPELSPKARICLRPQTDKRYQSAQLQLAANRARSATKKRGAVTVQDLQSDRDEDRDLFPRYLFVHWTDVLDDEGEPVEFSVDHAVELCEQMPDWLFDRIRAFTNQPANFLDEPVPDAGELAKNSESA